MGAQRWQTLQGRFSSSFPPSLGDTKPIIIKTSIFPWFQHRNHLSYIVRRGQHCRRQGQGQRQRQYFEGRRFKDTKYDIWHGQVLETLAWLKSSFNSNYQIRTEIWVSKYLCKFWWKSKYRILLNCSSKCWRLVFASDRSRIVGAPLADVLLMLLQLTAPSTHQSPGHI